MSVSYIRLGTAHDDLLLISSAALRLLTPAPNDGACNDAFRGHSSSSACGVNASAPCTHTLAASPPQTIAFGGLRYKITPAFQVSAASYYHAFRTVSGHAISSGVNADYLLSKRITLYTDVTYVMNSANPALSATGSTTPVATGANQLAVAVGIVHTF